MTVHGYNPHTRYRERSAQRIAKLMALMALAAVTCLLGFWLGRQYGAERSISLNDQVEALTQQRNLLQDSVTELRAETQTAEARYNQLREEFNTLIPEGPVQDLIRLVREQIEQGMEPERLAFVIRSARPPTGCTEPETKRFVVSNPAYQGPDSVVSVAEGAITISASGSSARNDDGQPEAWYDPAQPVNILFEVSAPEAEGDGGKQQERKNGILPIRHSIVAGDREYRFTVEAGSRSFARVVFDSCAYP